MDDILAPPSEAPESAKKYVMYVALGILVVNALILDFFVLFPKSQSGSTVLPGNITLPGTSQNSCSQGCLNQIDLALKSQKASASSVAKPVVQKPVASPSPTPRPTPTPTPLPTPIPVKTVKESFIPLGTGSGKAADWTVVEGIGAKIDPADYGDIKQVTFEVTAQTPTGNQDVWIRLYNANTYQSVAGSEVTLSGGGAKLLISSSVSLASGNNLYQIQMKTQLQYPVNISMARVRIKSN